MSGMYQVVGRKKENFVSDVKYESNSREAFRRFLKNKGAIISLAAVCILIILAVIAPILSPYRYDVVDVNSQNLRPGAEHFFGTDVLGRDLWTRIFIGTRISLYVAFVAVTADILIGVTYGMISGYFGGKTDFIMQRILEILRGVPTVVYVTLMIIVLKPGIAAITIALIISGWIDVSHMVRAQVLKLKESEYVLAAKTIGASDRMIIVKEILPNMAGQIVIMAMLSVPEAIFLEAYISFIGLGIPDPMASLGSLINSGFQSMLFYPYMVIVPVIIFIILMLSFNLMADGLRDALDMTMASR